MIKGTKVYWTLKRDDDGKLIRAGGTGTVISEAPVDGRVEVSAETSSAGDGRTHTVKVSTILEFGVDELIAQ